MINDILMMQLTYGYMKYNFIMHVLHSDFRQNKGVQGLELELDLK